MKSTSPFVEPSRTPLLGAVLLSLLFGSGCKQAEPPAAQRPPLAPSATAAEPATEEAAVETRPVPDPARTAWLRGRSESCPSGYRFVSRVELPCPVEFSPMLDSDLLLNVDVFCKGRVETVLYELDDPKSPKLYKRYPAENPPSEPVTDLRPPGGIISSDERFELTDPEEPGVTLRHLDGGLKAIFAERGRLYDVELETDWVRLEYERDFEHFDLDGGSLGRFHVTKEGIRPGTSPTAPRLLRMGYTRSGAEAPVLLYAIIEPRTLVFSTPCEAP